MEESKVKVELSDIDLESNDTSNKEQVNKKDEPIVYNKFRKVTILLIIGFAGILGPLASTIVFTSLKAIEEEFNTSAALVDASISCFMAFLGVCPLFWGGISDRFGRKTVFLTSQIIFILGNVGCALSTDINFLIGMRAIQGIGASAPIVTGVGTIIDVFSRSERGSALSFFFVGPLVGPVLGPIVGGFIDQYLGWRATFWTLTIMCGFLFLVSIFFLPETLPITSKKSFPLQIQNKPFRLVVVKESFFNPLQSLVFLKYPLVTLASLCIAVSFSTFFCVESTQSRIIPSTYNLNPSETGLTFIPLGLGSIAGNLLGGKISDWTYQRFTRRNEGIHPTPEIRLSILNFGPISSCFGHLFYGWAIMYQLPLYAPLIASVFIGIGTTMTTIAGSSYLVDNFPQLASTITGTYVCVQLVLSAIFTAFNSALLEALGYGVTLTIYAALCFLVIITLTTLLVKGDSLRHRTGPH